MAYEPSRNEQRLRDAGVIRETAGPLADQFRAVVEGLTPDEVDVIVAVRRRLDEADRVSGWTPGSDEEPPSLTIMMPP